ncbi:MAG TPA: glucose-6-phosphate isomerase [Albitalea sp.]|nr:glucose-6-phosphate isomerase [Albitalea sp.]
MRAARAAASGTMREAFAADPKRFETFSASDGDLLLDWSKCAVDQRTMELLEKLAGAADLEGRRAAMFSGKKINITEDRAVLHTALRNLAGKGVTVDGQDVKADVLSVLDAMGAFADAIRSGKAAGATGKKITDIVNIGIGGSDLGPAMATLALAPYHDGPRAHYVSNIDGAHIHDTLKGLSAETTLFIIASKTFTTVETMTNAETARKWVQKALGKEAVGKHFAAVSTALDKVAAFGIAPDRVFGFWDWVGGRYSLWSAIGLPIALAIGADHFRALLGGAHAMDRHFAEAPLAKNLPVLLALIDVWYRNFHRFTSRSVAPYHQGLKRLPAYLQQLEMESNGKRVDLDGNDLPFATSPVVWGEPGTNGQHAYFQMLHQGTDVIPVEFILVKRPTHALTDLHSKLLANGLAQSQALMLGKRTEQALAEKPPTASTQIDALTLARHRTFPGNRPSTTLLLEQLTPASLGALIALYEHRVFASGALWGINSFDQWGVELGKALCSDLLPRLASGRTDGLDGSTAGLMRRLLA